MWYYGNFSCLLQPKVINGPSLYVWCNCTKYIVCYWDHLYVWKCTTYRNEMPIQLRKLPRKTRRNKILQFLWQNDIHLQELFRLNIAHCYYVEDFITSLVLWDIMQIHFLCTSLTQINIVCITLCEHETKSFFSASYNRMPFPMKRNF